MYFCWYCSFSVEKNWSKYHVWQKQPEKIEKCYRLTLAGSKPRGPRHLHCHAHEPAKDQHQSEQANQEVEHGESILYMLCVDTYYDLKSDLYTASKNSTTENILKLHRVANTQLSFVSGQVLFLRVNIHILDPGVTPWRCAEIFVEFLQEWARYLFSLCHKLWHSIWVQWISRSSLRV